MSRRRKGRAGKKAQRREAGLQAQRHLGGLLTSPSDHPEEVLSSAAVHVIKTSRRHRLPLPSSVKELVCRKCWAHQAHSSTFRVRIKHGQRLKTCLKCGSIRRFGGGPKHHRRQHRGA